MAPQLVLGPLLRYANERDATVWVETDAACEVEVLGHGSGTFEIEGHHYALVTITDLEPGETYEYEVSLDGRKVWPEADSPFPPSVIRTISPDGRLNLSYGSCRVTVPHEPPYTLAADANKHGYERDALQALALRMMREPYESWPDALFLLGDQIYADKVSEDALEFIRSRRDTSEGPGEQVADFEEYTRLYREAWADPVIRWLLSTVSCSMVIDDHDVHDHWNLSAAWVREMREKDWWAERERGALASYWLYQFIGNLSPKLLASSRLLAEIRESEDGWPALERDVSDGARWSYCRDLEGTRLIVIDSRCGRILEEGSRSILDDAEWKWLEDHLHGDFDHLLIGTSDPVVLAPGLHHAERWGEALSEGAWGARAAKLAERMRRTLDFDHWAAFGESFER